MDAETLIASIVKAAAKSLEKSVLSEDWINGFAVGQLHMIGLVSPAPIWPKVDAAIDEIRALCKQARSE